MAGYADTKKLIEDTLVGRPAGSLIYPEGHQAMAMSLLDYIHSVELLGASELQGIATTSTVPVQPDNAKVSYIATVPAGQTYVFTNFYDQNGNSISITTGENTVSLLTFLWNGEYWQVQNNQVQLMLNITAGYLYAGIAIPTTNPGSPDEPVFYIAVQAGTYTNFGDIVVNDGEAAILKYVDSSWVKEISGLATREELSRLATREELSRLAQEVDTFVDHTDTLTVNIFDKSAATLNYYVNKNTGNLASLANYDATDYIPIDSRGLYFDKAYGGGAAIGCAVYNSSKQYIRGYTLDKQITFQEGDAYVRFTLKHQNIDAAMCVAGTVDDIPSEYVPYGYIRTYEVKDNIISTNAIKDKAVTQEKVTDDILIGAKIASDVSYQSPNLFDKSTAFIGSAISSSSGARFASNSYACSDFIPIPDNVDKLYQVVGWTASGVVGWACFNSSKAYTHGGGTKEITIQEGDAFICISLDLSNLDVEMLISGDASSAPAHYMPYGIIEKYQINDNTVPFNALDFRVVETGKNKLDPDDIVDHAYVNKLTGAIVSYTGTPEYSVTGYIPVSKKGLYFNAFYTAGTVIGAAVYDNSKTYIRSIGQTYVYEEGDAFVRYSLLTSDKATAQVEEGSVASEYENYTERDVINPDYIPNNTNDSDEETEIPVVLPQKIFAVVGDTLQVFFKQCVQAVEPLRYNILVACSKGRQYHRYFEYTPVAGDIGETTFDLYVKDDLGQIVGHGSCSLVTVAVPSSPVTTKKILCVGDSLTANGVWVAEAYRRLTGSGGTPAGNELTNISFVGSMGTGDAKYLGNSGWSWKSYCTDSVVAFRFTVGRSVSVNVGAIYSNNSFNYTVVEVSDNGTILCTTPRLTNTPQTSGILTKVSGGGDTNISYSAYSTEPGNPFWDGTKLTFIPYINQYCGGSIDEVFVLLGGNGLVNWKEDFSDYLGYIKSFADTLHSEYPSTKLVLMSMQFPSMELMMPGYGASGSRYADTYGILVSIANLRNVYKEFAALPEYNSFVSAIDIGCQFDGDYNYWVEQKAVNTRKTNITEGYDYNTLHPDNDGYRQFADAVYRKLAYDLQ